MRALALLALLLPAVLGAAARSDSVLARARWLHHHRHLDRSHLDSARVMLEQLRAAEPANESCLVWLARVRLLLGDHSRTRADSHAWYVRARGLADTLRRRRPDNPEGHLWWGNAQARIGEQQGVIRSLFMLGDVRTAFLRAVALKPDHVLGLYAVGRMYYELPGIAGGGLDKAEEYWLRALALEPGLTLTRISLAWTAERRRDWPRAREYARSVLATVHPSEPASFHDHDRPQALALLERIKDR
jgi:tetratricopeptide (TPR) repeat protein